MLHRWVKMETPNGSYYQCAWCELYVRTPRITQAFGYPKAGEDNFDITCGLSQETEKFSKQWIVIWHCPVNKKARIEYFKTEEISPQKKYLLKEYQKMKYRKLKGYKYELLDTLMVETGIYTGADIKSSHITLWSNGQLFIWRHYAWDGASGPAVDTKTFMRGSLVHDALYQLMREGLLGRQYRRYADRLLKQICIEDGMPKWRAAYVYWAVRTFGRNNSLPNKKPRGKIVEI